MNFVHSKITFNKTPITFQPELKNTYLRQQIAEKVNHTKFQYFGTLQYTAQPKIITKDINPEPNLDCKTPIKKS